MGGAERISGTAPSSKKHPCDYCGESGGKEPIAQMLNFCSLRCATRSYVDEYNEEKEAVAFNASRENAFHAHVAKCFGREPRVQVTVEEAVQEHLDLSSWDKFYSREMAEAIQDKVAGDMKTLVAAVQIILKQLWDVGVLESAIIMPGPNTFKGGMQRRYFWKPAKEQACPTPGCTFMAPVCDRHVEQHQRALANGMPPSGRHG